MQQIKQHMQIQTCRTNKYMQKHEGNTRHADIHKIKGRTEDRHKYTTKNKYKQREIQTYIQTEKKQRNTCNKKETTQKRQPIP